MAANDPAASLMTYLIADAARRTPDLRRYFSAVADMLPDAPDEASETIQRAFPGMSEDDRRTAFRTASKFLRTVAEECRESAVRLDSIAEVEGNG